MLLPKLVRHAVDDLQKGVTWQTMSFYALMILGAKMVSGIFLFLQRRIIIGMSRHVEYDLRQDF